MNILDEWIPDHLLSALGWTLVHSIWQLVLLSVVLWLALKVARTKGPAFSYNLSLLGMASAVLLVLGTFVYQLQKPAAATRVPGVFTQSLPAAPTELHTGQQMELFSLVDSFSGWIDSNIPLLVNLWFIGALLFTIRLATNLAGIRDLRLSSHVAKDFELEKSFYRLLGKMNLPSTIQLRIGNKASSPLTFGFLKPIVLLPAGLLFHLSPAHLEAILAHELAHIKRHDYLVNLIQSSLEVIFFYHPCFWWMSETVKELRENAADDLVVRSGIAPDTLAFALAEVVNFAKQPQSDLALAAAKKRNPTLQRIKRILGHPAQTYPQNPIISIPMILTLCISLGLVASAGQDAPEREGSVEPLISLSLPEVDIPHSDKDTVRTRSSKKVEVVQDQNGNTSKTIVWETDDAADLDGAEIWTYLNEDDANVIVINGDTLKSGGKNVFFFNGEEFSMPQLPVLDLPPAPSFEGMDVPPFAMEEFMAPMPPLAMAPMPSIPFDGFDRDFFASMDTTMTKEEREAWQKDIEKKSEAWAKKMEEQAKKWEEEMAPKMKEFEEKIKAWQEANEPKIKEFQKKMEEWQKAQEPKMKEFQEKMKIWQEEQQPKFEEFQRKMEVWQKENAAKMEELVERLHQEAEAQEKETKKKN
ncbi:M56 family metallopeptidase [Algoriphagus namhaensis]